MKCENSHLRRAHTVKRVKQCHFVEIIWNLWIHIAYIVILFNMKRQTDSEQ